MQIQLNLGQVRVKINPEDLHRNWTTGIGFLFKLDFARGSRLNDVKQSCIMEVQNTITGNAHELMVSGRIDGEGANRLEEVILAAMRNGATSIYVNLHGATFLCSAGLRVLLQYWRQMKNSQRLLQVVRPSPEVATVLESSGFGGMLVEKA